MNERTYRLLQGGIILAGLILEKDFFIYFFLVLSFFEGLTGWRIPVLVTRLRKQKEIRVLPRKQNALTRLGFDAEQMMRLTVATLLAISYFLFPEETWFFPWFMGAMLLMAGISNICPMVIYYRWLGFR